MAEREIICVNTLNFLKALPEVKSCTLHGSLASNSSDEYSDIDLRVDVSGCDNGKFMLQLPDLLSKVFDIGYFAYAPKFVPDLYLITIFFVGSFIFHFVDIECLATPHFASVTREELVNSPAKENVVFKMALLELKSYFRRKAFSPTIERLFKMVAKTEASIASEKGRLVAIFDYFVKNTNKFVSDSAIKAKELLI
jgi:predicted nucleotidyltransferase